MFKKAVFSILIIIALVIPVSIPTGVSADTFFCRLASALVDHAQGEMAGEVTANSAILQSRLTLKNFNLLGIRAEGCFEIADNTGFTGSSRTEWVTTSADSDYIIKQKITGLTSGSRYYYRVLHRACNCSDPTKGPTCTFKTLSGPGVEDDVSFAVVTGMNYFTFHFFPQGPSNRHLGYPALETIKNMNPDFFVGTGDNVYYDAFPIPKATKSCMRLTWHMQFVQPRFLDLFRYVPTYWEKDDHDFRYNDADSACTVAPSAELGIQTFLEQVPVVDPDDPDPKTYRTHRINKLLQIWLVENRDYRSPNMMEPGPTKTLWGETQKAWLKQTLEESNATFKILISPTAMVGPDELYVNWPSQRAYLWSCYDNKRRESHINPFGFKYEGDEFFSWLAEPDNGLSPDNFFIICGDRHWKYHSIRPDEDGNKGEGFEEFSCGALIDANIDEGVRPGDDDSTDPYGLIEQPYIDEDATGGFLKVDVSPGSSGDPATCTFTFYDENGVVQDVPVVKEAP